MKKKLRYIFLTFFLLFCGMGRVVQLNLETTTLPQGGVAVFRLDGIKPGGKLSVSFEGGEVFISEDGGLGILAVDLTTAPGEYDLNLEHRGGKLTRRVVVTDGDFGVQRLKLSPEMVTLSEDTLKRVRRESGLIKKVWSMSVDKPLWQGNFVMPVDGPVTGVFGTRRILNGEERSPHSGVDIAAPEGAPVAASNSGRVAFVGDFFFYGKFIVIDHGLGIFTLYAHLSEVKVVQGEVVEKGAVIGEVGKTGRATGPHLHFSVKVGRARVSPDRLFAALGEGGGQSTLSSEDREPVAAGAP